MPILFSLSDRQLWQLARLLQPAAFKKGATVFRAGDEADTFYIVQSGGFSCFTSEWLGRCSEFATIVVIIIIVVIVVITAIIVIIMVTYTLCSSSNNNTVK